MLYNELGPLMRREKGGADEIETIVTKLLLQDATLL
jgi:hypothetical protein